MIGKRPSPKFGRTNSTMQCTLLGQSNRRDELVSSQIFSCPRDISRTTQIVRPPRHWRFAETPYNRRMLIETHAHLDYSDFAPDFDDVLRRATDAGVTRIITIGTSVESSRRAIEIAEKYPNVYAVIGVHPTYAGEAEEDVTTPLREVAQN